MRNLQAGQYARDPWMGLKTGHGEICSGQVRRDMLQAALKGIW